MSIEKLDVIAFSSHSLKIVNAHNAMSKRSFNTLQADNKLTGEIIILLLIISSAVDIKKTEQSCYFK